jgi:integrase
MSSDLSEQHRQIQQGIAIQQDRENIKESARAVLEGQTETAHARDDALSPRQFEQLVNATYDIDSEEIAVETRAVLFLCGRIGLRKGEVTHLRESWFDWGDGTLTIPEHQPCTKGQHGDELCGYCRRRAEDRVSTHTISHEEALSALQSVTDTELNANTLDKQASELQAEVNISMEDATAKQWQPKTKRSARTVPFDFDVRVKLALEAFFTIFDAWEKSAATVNRRINRLEDISPVNTRLYPHALRATAASYHASRDISIHSLMSIMGWSDPSTARSYVNANPDQAAREIRSKHR